MKAITRHGTGDVRVESVPDPPIKVMLKPSRAGLL